MVITQTFYMLTSFNIFNHWIYFISNNIFTIVASAIESQLFSFNIIEVILVRIFPAFFRSWAEYGEILSISPYSVQMRENAGKMRTRITPNTGSFYAVWLLLPFFCVWEIIVKYLVTKWESWKILWREDSKWLIHELIVASYVFGKIDFPYM